MLFAIIVRKSYPQRSAIGRKNMATFGSEAIVSQKNVWRGIHAAPEQCPTERKPCTQGDERIY